MCPARILDALRMFLLPVLGSSQPPPRSTVPRPFCGLSSFSSPFHSLLPCSSPPSWTMRQDGAPQSQRQSPGAPGSLRAHVLGRGRVGAVMSRRCPAPGGRSAPGPTPPSSHRANPEVEEEVRRWWQSGQALAEPYQAACLGLGARGRG